MASPSPRFSSGFLSIDRQMNMNAQAFAPCDVDHVFRASTHSIPQGNQSFCALGHLFIAAIACGFAVSIPVGRTALAWNLVFRSPHFPEFVSATSTAADYCRRRPSASCQRGEQFASIGAVSAACNDCSHSFLSAVAIDHRLVGDGGRNGDRAGAADRVVKNAAALDA